MKKLLRVVRKPTGGGGWWYDYQYGENKMSRVKRVCRNCGRIEVCSLMTVKTEGGKKTEDIRVCGECWDKVYEADGYGSEHGYGGRRIIRSTKPQS